MSHDRQELLIGVDAQAFTAIDQYPAMLFHYCNRHLSALIQTYPNIGFKFFVRDHASSNLITKLFPFSNVIVTGVGEEGQSQLSLYYIPDQLSLLPSRVAPLQFAPRTVALSVLSHNMLAASASNLFLKKWPTEVVGFYLHALEMITASPAQILCPSALEAQWAKCLMQLPDRQISRLGEAAAIPTAFVIYQERLNILRSRLNLPETFFIAPSDTLSQEGEQELLHYWRAVRELAPSVVLLRPALRKYVATFLPDLASSNSRIEGIIFEPELTYEEFLELLAMSSGYILPGRANSSAGVFEAAALGCKVFYTQPTQDRGSILTSPQDLISTRRSFADPINLESALRSSWTEVANETMNIWRSQIL